MAKCLKTVICNLFLISLSACGANQEHTANSDTEATPEKSVCEQFASANWN